MSSDHPTRSLEITQASVVVDKGHETTYRRAGRGTSVLLLSSPGDAVAMLFGPLAKGHRVYAPTLPMGTGEASPASLTLVEWLRGFLDALGVTRISIVANESVGASAIGYALFEPFRVARVILALAQGNGESSSGMTDALRDARVPVHTTWCTPAGGMALLAEVEGLLALPSID